MRSFLALALCAVPALAQRIIQFNSNPSDVQVGKAVNITYTLSNPDAPATITLRQGDANNLDTVEIITNDATGTSFSWTPSKSLVDGTDYALYIQQGNDDNYGGRFAISGGAQTSSASSSKTSASSTTGSASSSASGSTTGLPGGTLIAPGSGGFSNRTTASAGTGMLHMTRNSTMSRATLTSTKTTIESTGGAEMTASQTSSSSSTPSSTSGATAVIYGSSPLALVLCIFAAIMV